MGIAEITQLIISVFILLGMIFGVYKYFRSPDEKAAREIALLKEQLSVQKNISAEAIKTNQNCIHSLEGKIETLTNFIINPKDGLVVRMATLETILTERLPKR